jgi:hypothetical protein
MISGPGVVFPGGYLDSALRTSPLSGQAPYTLCYAATFSCLPLRGSVRQFRRYDSAERYWPEIRTCPPSSFHDVQIPCGAKDLPKRRQNEDGAWREQSETPYRSKGDPVQGLASDLAMCNRLLALSSACRMGRATW